MPTINELVLPDLKAMCPWPVATNPHFDKALPESSAWIDSFGFFSDNDAKRLHFKRSMAELLSSYTYPYAGPEELRVCCEIMGIFWVTDELFDDMEYPAIRGQVDTYIKAMKGEPCDNSDRIVRMVNEWKERFSLKVRPNTERRFINTYVEYLESLVEERKTNGCEGFNLQQYEKHRRNNTGSAPSLALIEYARGIDLPDAVFEDETFLKIFQATQDILGYTNDIYSYSRERDIGLDGNNLLTILMRDKTLSIQEAVYYAGEMIRTLISSFQEHRARLPSFKGASRTAQHGSDQSEHNVDKDVQIYVQSLEFWIIGQIYWSFATKRYFGSAHREVERSLVVELKEPTD